MPALPRNCYQTPHGYLFRIIVPELLRPFFGKREIKKALGRDYRQAVSKALHLAFTVDRQFSEARERLDQEQGQQNALDAYLAIPRDKRHLTLTEVTPELVASLRSLWLASLDGDLARRNEGIDDEDYEELEQNVTQKTLSRLRSL